MARKRPYKLLCPIARALDVLGDRWTLLILRDLHAGPARFGELERGLGMAANLLTTRLAELIETGLIERAENEGVAGYQLTALGRDSDLILWELARFGALLEPESDPRAPGNLRTVVVPLRILFGRAPDRPVLTVRLQLDDETIVVRSGASVVDVFYGDTSMAADLTLASDYPSFLAVGEGRMEPAAFASKHLIVVSGEEHLATFLGWFARAIEHQTTADAAGR